MSTPAEQFTVEVSFSTSLYGFFRSSIYFEYFATYYSDEGIPVALYYKAYGNVQDEGPGYNDVAYVRICDPAIYNLTTDTFIHDVQFEDKYHMGYEPLMSSVYEETKDYIYIQTLATKQTVRIMNAVSKYIDNCDDENDFSYLLFSYLPHPEKF